MFMMGSWHFIGLYIILITGMVSCYTIYGNDTSVREHIFGGKKILIARVPYHIMLHRNGKHVCGGSLISYKHVLTAAHCVIPEKIMSNDSVKIIAGTNDINDPGITKVVQNIYMHPEFQNETPFPNDIAVLVLKEPFPQTMYIAPLKLPSKPIVDGESVRIVGMGRINDNEEMSPYLKTYKATMLTYESCIKKFSILQKKIICDWIESGTGVCKGDSGAPLVNKHGEIVGIHSATIRCAEGKPNTDTDVYSHLDFIEKHIH